MVIKAQDESRHPALRACFSHLDKGRRMLFGDAKTFLSRVVAFLAALRV